MRAQHRAPPRVSEARAALRAATDAQHAALHRHATMSTIVEGSVSEKDYRRLMGQIQAFYGRHEAGVIAAADAFSRQTGGYRFVPRLPALERELGHPPPRDLPVARPLATSPAALAGVAYVLDGAMNGAQIIDAAIRHLPWRSERPTFWAWCRAEAPAIWRSAREFIDRADISGSARHDMIGGAQATFAAFAAAVRTS